MKLIDSIFSITSEEQFNKCCINVFQYQYTNTPIYKSYCDQLKIDFDKISHYHQIPFLPIEFYKTQKIISDNSTAIKVFKSSGTGGIRSKHYVADLKLYTRSFMTTYINRIGEVEDQVILALLPNYIDNGDSSLIYMVDALMKKTKSNLSGYILDDSDQLLERYNSALKQGKKIVLFGVSYALLDLSENSNTFPELTIIETGGMKGKRKEITKRKLHNKLKNDLGCEVVYSEYGMTELLSQAYSTDNLEFICPPWMQVIIREINDPFKFESNGKTGGVNIIDLANIFSCSFISTQDLGRISKHGFEILGRFDNSDIRGCNLLVD